MQSADLKSLLLPTQEGRVPVPMIAILREARELHQVSERLARLAENHPLVSDALLTVSSNVRQTATLLEVLVMTRMGPPPGTAPAEA
jgi:hypothetical protein